MASDQVSDINNTAETGQDNEPGPVSRAYRRYAIGLLFLLYVMNYLDRQIVNILAEDIKRDLHLLDWQLGMLTGFAFAVLYCIAGFPIARLAEQHSRPKILGISAAIWSLFTIACGMTQNFWQLVLARAGVGVGESGCAPTAFSLISDYAPRKERSSALALFSMGAPTGMLLGMAAGGLIAQNYGWRAAFFICGVPGIILSIIAAFTLREPRGKAPPRPRAERPNFQQELGRILMQRSFILLACGAAINNLLGYGRAAFYAPHFLRNEAPALADLADASGLGTLGTLGLAVGLATGLGGMLGSYLGGLIGDRFGARDPRWYGFAPAIAALCNIPAFMLTMSLPLVPALFMLSVASMTNTIWYGSVYNATQSVTPQRSRATAAAVLLSFITLIGLALGPPVIGALSDIFLHLLGGDTGDGLRLALIVSAPLGLVSVGCFLWASRYIKAELLE